MALGSRGGGHDRSRSLPLGRSLLLFRCGLRFDSCPRDQKPQPPGDTKARCPLPDFRALGGCSYDF